MDLPWDVVNASLHLLRELFNPGGLLLGLLRLGGRVGPGGSGSTTTLAARGGRRSHGGNGRGRDHGGHG